MKRSALYDWRVVVGILISLVAWSYCLVCLIVWIGKLIHPSDVIWVWGMQFVHPVWFFIALVIAAPLLIVTILEDIHQATEGKPRLPAARPHPAPPDEDAYYRDHLYNDQESNE
jgi:hypothetical protein